MATQTASASQLAKFELAISLALSSWDALSLAVRNEWGGPESADKRDWFAGAVSELFVTEPATDAADLELLLLQIMEDEFEVAVEDGSAIEVAAIIIRAKDEIGMGITTTLDALWARWKRCGDSVGIVQAGPDSESDESINDERLDDIVLDELLNLHRGQGLELVWRDSLTCPTEDEYIDMVNNKTGGLFRAAVKLMMAKSQSNVDYVPLVNLIGVYFQIRDDYMNLQSTQYAENKGFCEDLTEGKFSFPIVHAVRADTTNRQVLNVLQKRPTTPTTKIYITSYMRNHTRSFAYTLDVMHNLERQARQEIERLGGNPKLVAIIDSLAASGAPP